MKRSPESRGIIRRSAAAVTVAGALLLSACGSDSPSAREEAASAQEAAADAQRVAAEKQAEADKATQAAAVELAQDLAKKNQECGDAALKAAQVKYTPDVNYPETEIDETHDGLVEDTPLALADMQKDTQACMEAAFTSIELDGYTILPPIEFAYPNMPVAPTTSTTVAG